MMLRRELKVQPEPARRLMIDAVNAAGKCAHRMNERTQAAEVYERASKVKAALRRLSNCTRRAPAKLRHRLDEKIATLLESGEVNLEAIEALFQTSRTVFDEFRDMEAARSGVAALGVYKEYGYDTLGLANDFSSLSPLLQENCKVALSLSMKSRTGIAAVAVFNALVDGIAERSPPPKGATDIVITYVAAVAEAWRSSGLRGGRAVKADDPSYTSKFHRFCDLVLTALVEPESRRHRKGLNELSDQAWARQKRLPREVRKYVRGGLSRKDSQWLVTAHCLREGLRLADSKKSMRDSI